MKLGAEIWTSQRTTALFVVVLTIPKTNESKREPAEEGGQEKAYASGATFLGNTIIVPSGGTIGDAVPIPHAMGCTCYYEPGSLICGVTHF